MHFDFHSREIPMATKLARFKSLLLGFCMASVLVAQVDKKLLTNTDILDVYKSGGGTPEMLTIFDMSGSMVNCFWHQSYWTNLNSDSGNNMTIDVITGQVTISLGGGITAKGYLVDPSGTQITDSPITVASVLKASHARLTAEKTSGSKTYTRTLDIPVPWTLLQIPTTLPALPSPGTAPVSDFYVDPKNGTSVEFDTVYTTSSTRVVNLSSLVTVPITGATWSSTANTVTYTTSVNHGLVVGDDVDISGIVPAAYNTTGATGSFVVTAVPTTKTFKVSMMANPGTFVSGGTMSTGGTGRLGYFTYNPDYIYWLFWGNVAKAADGNSYVTTPVTSGYNDDRNQAPPGGGIFTTSTAGLGGSYPAGGGYVIPGVYDSTSGSTSTPSKTVWSDNKGTTFKNGIPAGTRSMFLKKAVLQTWLAKQGQVVWAYRFLDTSGVETSTPSSTNFGSGDRYLTLLNSATGAAIDPSVVAIQQKFPANGTPLTSALANAYAQMINTGISATKGSNPGNVFDTTNSGNNPSPCTSSFVILFTDGMANTDTIGPNEVNLTSTPPTGVLTEADLQNIPFSYLDESANKNFNIWSLAAVAAHGKNNGTNNASQKTTGSFSPSSYAPFHIMNRGAEGTSGRKITTMTVGLSLAGTNTSSFSTGGKGPLLRTALYGDPTKTALTNPAAKFDLINSVAYGKTPLATSGVSTNFFDASDPDALISSLAAIIAAVTQANTSITAPAAPLVGLNLGNRAYLGRFSSTNAGDGSGSVWQGDLLMAGIGVTTGGTIGLKDNTGNFQVDINAGNAVASASAIFIDPVSKNTVKSWKTRNIYTMVPGTAIPVGGLDLTLPTQAFSDTNGLLTPTVMGVTNSTAAGSLIRFIRGASKAAQADTTNTTNRQDIMGDIINSSPAALEYNPKWIKDDLAGDPNNALASLWSSYSTMTDPRIQVIFVGDNQGHFHAFGEVSALDGAGVLKATLVELWSFVPPELLNKPTTVGVVPKLSFLQGVGNSHSYTVDGSPYIYFNDAPLTGLSTGNRQVDGADTVRVLFGMRKGGRSYYALDVVNPFHPKLVWMLDPNNSSDPAIKTMGLATSTPAVARVETGSPASVKDVVFIGGGYSNNALDATPSGIGNNTGPAKLGRSLLAVDIADGTIVKSYDFVNNASLATNFPNMGAIGAGAFPFEFYVGSKKAQRVYFADLSGGVYALGSMQTLTTSPVGWRLDNSNIDQWTTDGSLNVSTTPGNAGIRWIYKGATTVTGGVVTASSPISGTPAAYRLPKAIPQFLRPSTSSNAPNMIPPVVGVTFGTGDRNDPMDLDPVGTVGGAPYRQVMVFDRQDSGDLPTVSGLPSNVNGFASAITDAQLSDQTATTSPGDTNYLGNNQYLGYYLRFHPFATDPITHKLVGEKAYLNVLVQNGGLIFSTFRPVATGNGVACEGAGYTYTFRMCDALAPVFSSGDVATTGTTDKALSGCNGYVFSWTNLAGDLASIGSRMVIQSGQDAPIPGVPTTSNVKIQTLVVQSGTQSFAPRSWRIIR